MDTLLLNLSNNKFFGGCIILLTNIGGKYIALDMPNNIEKIFSKYLFLRCLVLFSILFMATRDIKIAILLSLLFLIIVKFFMNEKSKFCIIKSDEQKLSEHDYKKATEIISKYRSQNA